MALDSDKKSSILSKLQYSQDYLTMAASLLMLSKREIYNDDIGDGQDGIQNTIKKIKDVQEMLQDSLLSLYSTVQKSSEN